MAIFKPLAIRPPSIPKNRRLAANRLQSAPRRWVSRAWNLDVSQFGKTPSRSNSDTKQRASVALTLRAWILNDNFGNDIFHFNYLTSDSQELKKNQ